jgi:mono/diheme cytochrome c family protein/glucose/arabinose dehydrogenase
MRLLPVLTAALVAGLSTGFAQNGDRPDETQSPPPADLVIPPAPTLVAEEALKTIQAAPGYRLEIVAADPLVGDPVAAVYGPDGRLWVLEMRGFMPNADGKGEDAKVGAVAVLTDTDHDGRMDRRTVFLDGLVLPRALALVDDGVLVAEPPNLWFCRDTNGDGKADEKTAVATDYGTPGNPEHTANGLYRAMDNWIYSVNHNVRYRYLGAGKFAQELTVTRGQWGLSQDDAGRLFHNSNSDPARYDAVPSQYYSRNPNLTETDGDNVQLVPVDLRVWPLRVTPGINRGYKSLDATGRMTAVTAACAPLVYRGDLMPELRGDVLVCEPSGNLIKRISLAADGDRIVGRNAYEGAEFIASTDERFRPVNLLDGPDGAIHVVDMYRGIIQHRIYLTTYLRKQIDERGLAEGMGMGRVYRLVPAASAKPIPAFDLAKESSPALVARLASPAGWWRDTAQRLLVERRDPAALPALRKLAVDTTASATTRLHALWTLEGIDGLDRETVRAAMDETDATVRVGSLQLAGKFLAGGDPELLHAVINLQATDAAPLPHAVMVQQCLALGDSRDPAVVPALFALARAHGDRPFVAGAIASGLAGRETDFVAAALAAPDAGTALKTARLAATCVWRSGDAIAAAKLDQLLGAADAPAWATDCLLESLRAIIPIQSNKQLLTARLSVVPHALLRLAAADSPHRERAVLLRNHLRWPGNEERAVAAVPLTPAGEQLFAKGKEVYASICAGCHQPTGLGLPGLAPSLVTSQWVPGDERVLARIVLQGKMREGAVMPPLGSLDDESLAGALTYIRRSWGHGFAEITTEAIVRARQETAGRAEPWTETELAKVRDAVSVAPESN